MAFMLLRYFRFERADTEFCWHHGRVQLPNRGPSTKFTCQGTMSNAAYMCGPIPLGTLVLGSLDFLI
jgi:hypothetical protein